MKSFFSSAFLFIFIAASSYQLLAQPNVLLILSDDHSVPHLGSYGDPNCRNLGLTPNLDALAEQGMRFDRAYTSAPQCAPSRTSIFAGRSPVGISATRFAQPARTDVMLFTDLLRGAGYWVGLEGRHQHLDGKSNDLPHVAEALVDLGMRGEEFESRFDYFVRGAKTKGEALNRVGEVVGLVLDAVPQEQPWFLYFGFNQPHRSFGEDYEGIDPLQLVLPPDWPDLPGVRLDYARYLAEVRDLDRGVGLVLDLLKSRGLEKDTLVIFMGDNGEALLRGKGTLATRGIHVPLIIRWPGVIEAGSESEHLISGVDLAPTILSAANVEPDKGMTGVSFLPLLKGDVFKGRERVFAERGWHWGPLTRSDGFDLVRSVTTKRYHFVYNAIPEREHGPTDMSKGNNVAWEEIKEARARGELSKLHERLFFRLPRPVFELYDLEKDPYQLENLAGGAATQEVEEQFREKLDRWMVKEGDYLPLPSHVHQISIGSRR